MGKNWECNRCAKNFSSHGTLNRHRKGCGIPLKDRSVIPCTTCGQTFTRQYNLEEHNRKSCHGGYKCGHCSQSFPSRMQCKRHELTCHERKHVLRVQDYTCERCGQEFEKPKDLRKHYREVHAATAQPPPRAKARRCGHLFNDFRSLRSHQLDEHMGGGGLLHREPDWLNQAGDELALTFRRHANVILGGHDTNPDLVHTYNFASDDDSFNATDFEEHVEYIYRKESKAFKINFSFGTILQNRETLEFRYFHPYRNTDVFERPLLVSNARDLKKLLDTMKEVNILAKVFVDRPDTKWRLVLVTNVKYSVYVTSFALGCAGITLPSHIENNKYVKTLLLDNSFRGGLPYNDHKCFFRCLATHRGVGDIEDETDEYKQSWVTVQGDIGQFLGVHLEEMEDLEELFQININVLALAEGGEAVTLFASTRHFPDSLYLDLFDTHLSLITDIEGYAKKYTCQKCLCPFSRHNNCVVHAKTCNGDEGTKFKFPGGFYKHSPTIFEKMAEYGVETPEVPFYPFFIVYDYESILEKVEPEEIGANTQWLAKHVPISVSVCSNVPGYEEPRCIVDDDISQLVSKKIAYMHEIQEVATLFARIEFADTLQRLEEAKNEFQRLETAGVGEGIAAEIETLQARFERWLTAIPVLSFNGAGYDLQLVMTAMVEQLDLHQDEGFVIKKGRKYICVSTEHFRFLDASQYLAANTSYAQFLRAYDCCEQKGHFPYEWFDRADKLDWPSLPPYEAFFSSLKNQNTLEVERTAYDELLKVVQNPVEVCRALGVDEPPLTGRDNYTKLQTIWQSRGMQTFHDFLIYYSDLDTRPFVEAVIKMREPYRARGVDMFKDAVSVPGIARILLFRSARENDGVFAVFGDRDKDLHETFLKNVVGGPSIIYTRRMESGKTFIRGGPELCESVQGYDASNLYGSVLKGDIPCGPYVRRHEDNDYIPEKRERYMSAFHWLDYVQESENIEIEHYLNSGKEVRISGLPMDGFCRNKNMVLEFHGCWHHGHEHVTEKTTDPELKKELMSRREKTKTKINMLRQLGYFVREKWQCQFTEDCRRDRELAAFVHARQPPFFRDTRYAPQTMQQVLTAVESGLLTGFIECDIHVPESWQGKFRPNLDPYEYFHEFCPIFCNGSIPFDAIGRHMQDYVENCQRSEYTSMGMPEEDFVFKTPPPKRLLIGGMKAERILLATPLVKWYLEHGLQITRIYQVLEFKLVKCFKPFIDGVTDMRRQADMLAHLKILANTAKLLSNSSYGSLLLNRSKHNDVKYVQGRTLATQCVKNPRFKQMSELSKSIFEVSMEKANIYFDLPTYVGIWVLNIAKLVMLQFVYDVIDLWISRSCYQICFMDTDSIYLGLSKDNLRKVISPEYLIEFIAQTEGSCHLDSIEAGKFTFPRTCCPRHALHDKREPGLFNLEYQGENYIGLCSKTDCCSSTTQGVKFSCKGLQKDKVRERVFDRYDTVLDSKETTGVRNVGFRQRDNSVWTYSQFRRGLSYYYCKREVHDNGTDTSPLSIILNPWK